jgi:phosphatidate cytidylyltransferase
LKLRIITSIIGLPLLIFVVISGGTVLKAVLFGLILIAMSEVYKALSGKVKPVHAPGFVFSAVYMFFIDYVHDYKVLTIILILMTISTLCSLVMFYGKTSIVDACYTIFGFYYVAILLSSVYLVRNHPNHGGYFVWMIFIAAWGSDTGAYFIGKLFGRHKLVPKLSPKKTVEGAVGGTIIATLLALAYGFILSRMLHVDDVRAVTYCVVTGFFGSIFAQFGDLTASAIKRLNGVKDFGALIPGHGGVMDRFDSILFTAPAIYLLILLMSK